MAKAPSTTIALFVYQETSHGQWYHVRAYPVTIGLTLSERLAIDRNEAISAGVKYDTIRNVSSYSYDAPSKLQLAGLEIYSQGNNDDGDKRNLYAWQVRYKDQDVTIDTVKRLYQTLTTVDKRMTATQDEYGRAKTFGQYVLYVAKAIGASEMIIRTDDRRAWDYSEMEYSRRTLADGADQIDWMIKKWTRQGTSTAEISA